MEKQYKTPSELIEILAKRGMKFSHPLVAKRNLEGINYFFLKGYQKILLQSENTFKDNCDFTELTNLYFFDKELKALILEYLLDIEQKIKTAISNVISSKYGINDRIYLRRTNFDISNSHLDDILALVRKQRQIYGKTNQAIKHYKEKYNYVPFYVLSKCLTFGTVKKIFNVMKQEDQIKVCNSILFCEINSRKISKVKLFIALISDVRNMCAHDEIIFDFIHNSIDIGLFPEHEYFELKRNDNQDIIQGRKDLFAVLLSMKYLMNRTDYSNMIKKIDKLITNVSSKSLVYTKKELLNEMRLPLNFLKIKEI